MCISYAYAFVYSSLRINDTKDRIVASLDGMDFVVVDEGGYHFRIAVVDCPMV